VGGQANRALNTERSNDLNDFALLATWHTPVVRDHRNSHGDGSNPRDLPRQAHLVIGPTATGSTAATGNGGQLNSAFSRWLQGYPVAWCQAAIRAHRMRTPRRKRASVGSEATGTASSRKLARK